MPALSVGHQAGADLGPVISPAAKERVCKLVQSGVDQGAKVINGECFDQPIVARPLVNQSEARKRSRH